MRGILESPKNKPFLTLKKNGASSSFLFFVKVFGRFFFEKSEKKRGLKYIKNAKDVEELKKSCVFKNEKNIIKIF